MPPRARAITENANNDEAGDAPPLAIPSGVDAQVNIKYNTRVDPNQDGTARARELAELTALAGDDLDEPPPDEISAFCHTWQNFAGYPLAIIRLPDPPERRLAGNSYARPCFNLERLGDTTFDPSNLIGTLQFVNNNSGGVFRVWLVDYNGAPIPGARVERIAIADPPHDRNTVRPVPLLQQQAAPQATPPAPREKSESEKQLESVKDQLFTTALTRALNPPQQQPLAGNGQPTLPPDQQAMLYMLGNTDFVGQMFTKLADLAQQTAGVTKEPSLKERALDAGMEILSKNPAIIERVSGIADRIIGRIFGPDPRYDTVFNQAAPPVYNQTPAYMPSPQPQQQAANPGAFVPDNTPPDAPEQDDTDEDMDILEELTTLLNSNTPLTLDNPTLAHLEKTYPVKFGFALRMIAANPLDVIIDWIKATGGPLYVSLLEGPASGPFLRQRLGELQLLIKTAIEEKQNAKRKATDDGRQTTETTATQTQNTQAEDTSTQSK